MLDVVKQVAPSIPFDADRLDRLMDEAGIDILLVTSKHNVQYLLGGHRAFFFESMDAMGLSRYLPVLVYPKGGRQKAAYFGHRMEGFQKENNPFWVPESQTNSSGSVDAMEKAIDYIRKSGVKTRRIGAELAFLPVDSGTALRNAFPGSEIVDALFVLERQRAVKSPEELQQLRIASERVIEFDDGGHCKPRSGDDQAGPDRSASAGGDQPRPRIRLLPDHGRNEPQPRSIGAEMGKR